ncbi:hypothetical protein ACIQ7N_16845 [Lysinibacillus sp. NPDC095746]|uniref:hypothetical protein n=1 Tax=Lysinibacillus sp. NPDC095746 TaxID=3364134 RepID=UPI0037F667BD
METTMVDSEDFFKKILLLWSGQLSAIRSGLTVFGLAIYVFQQPGKASAMTLGFLLAFLPSLSGILADYMFTPLLVDGGLPANTGTGYGKGTGLLIIIAGILLCVTSFILFNLKSVKKLENRGDVCISD